MSAEDLLDALNVNSPCTADWESMVGNDQVRFCCHCNLSVHNLSKLTPKQALRLIRRSRGRLCVRYLQLSDGAIKAARPPSVHRIGRHASRIVAGAFSATLTVSSAAATTVPFDRSLSISRRHSQIESPLVIGGSIHGFVFDPNGSVVKGAMVSIATQDGKDYYLRTFTNGDGEYRFADLEPGPYTLRIEASGFATSEVAGIVLRADREDRIDQTLSTLTSDPEVQPPREVTIQGSAAAFPTDPLVRAAQMDDLEAIRQLLVGKPDVNVRDKRTHATALQHAVLNGNREAIQLLLTAGADVNLRDKLGQTPLMLLGEKITPEIVWDLIHAGARINLRDEEGDTALIEAAACNNLEVLKILLDAGAKVDARNNDGETALMRAASEGLVNNVRTLIRAGADPNVHDNEGKTPWMYALEDDHTPVLRLLRSYGVDETAEPVKTPPRP
jgi:hypothetical protein